METSRRRFVKTSCLGALCFCGFGRLLGANTPALEDIEEASDTMIWQKYGLQSF